MPGHQDGRLFGGRDYILLFFRLTADAMGHRTGFCAGSGAVAPDGTFRRLGEQFTKWYYQCARAFLEGKLAYRTG